MQISFLLGIVSQAMHGGMSSFPVKLYITEGSQGIERRYIESNRHNIIIEPKKAFVMAELMMFWQKTLRKIYSAIMKLLIY